jgi:hypothetical protein
MLPKERYKKLKEYLSAENPVLLEVINYYQELDKVAYKIGLLDTDETYTSNISWWPMISILGTFSAGKSTFINDYLGADIQQTGNQAIDDKFTVMCYGDNEEVTTLPGLALDADPRFPFYNISKEVEKVDPGEGNRVNLYLQLKTLNSPKLKGKILIDSPGFDADSQRDGILKITNHIVEMSDLVLIFFDARHPEPGAMRDTLEHLVSKAIAHKDANKILYILNQIDTTIKEDNLEDVIGSWQRALSQEGLISGNFFGIYNEEAANSFEDEKALDRLKGKKDADHAKILDRMQKVGIERAYRIIKSLDDYAKEIKDHKIPILQEALQKLSSKVFYADMAVIGLLLVLIIYLHIKFDIFATVLDTLEGTVAAVGVFAVILLSIHMKINSFLAKREAKSWENRDIYISKAITHNASWWRSLFGFRSKDWQKSAKNRLDNLMIKGRESIQKLNDQYVSPSGLNRDTQED